MPCSFLSRRLEVRAIAFYAALVLALVAGQIIYTPARFLNPDNMWHFRFARDLATGRDIFWSAIDANRLFPDLVFSRVALALPGGGNFGTWIFWFYLLVVLSLSLSIYALSRGFHDSEPARRTFLVTMAGTISVFLLAFPFWDRWFLDPGNHGTALPVCFACLALLFTANRRKLLSPPAGLAFLLGAALVVGSNRYLLIVFVTPLFAALLLVWGPNVSGRARHALPVGSRLGDRRMEICCCLPA